MAWEWSHTEDAYEAVHQQLQDKADSAADGDREAQEWLLTVWAEWNAEDWRDWRSCDRFNPRAYGKALRATHKLTRRNVDGWHRLAEDIWENSQELRLCTNGGWEAYVCPSGCGCHLIPFSPE